MQRSILKRTPTESIVNRANGDKNAPF